MKDKILNLNGMVVNSNTHFLIIEDEKDISDSILEILDLIGFNGPIYQAFNIKMAKEYLQENKVEYILSDWNLPDGKGISLLKAIRSTKKYECLPFLMITANNDVDSMIISSKIGVSEYLVKPFTVNEFQSKLVEGWKYHLVKNEDFILTLKNKILELEQKIIYLEKENNKLKNN